MSINLVTGYAGKGHITSADAGCFNAGIFGDETYLLKTGDQFACEKIDNNTIRIHSGDLIAQGRHIRIPYGSTETLTIENGTIGKERIDLVVVRYYKNANTGVESASLIVLKGVEVSIGYGASSTNSELKSDNIFAGSTNEDIYHDVCLYQVKISELEISEINKTLTAANTLIDLAPTNHKHSASDITSGTLPISRGGTGATTAAQARTNLGINNATTTTSGLLSAADKVKLDGIDKGANKTIVDSALSATSTNPVQNKVVEKELSNHAQSIFALALIFATIESQGDLISVDSNGCASGCLQLGKILIQWGELKHANSAAETVEAVAVTFQKDRKYADNKYLVFASSMTTVPNKISVSAAGQTTTGFNIEHYRTNTQASDIIWLAIGKATASSFNPES